MHLQSVRLKRAAFTKSASASKILGPLPCAVKDRQNLNLVVLKPVGNQERSAKDDYLSGSRNTAVTSCVRISFQYFNS